jgi:hypothetical protein
MTIASAWVAVAVWTITPPLVVKQKTVNKAKRCVWDAKQQNVVQFLSVAINVHIMKSITPSVGCYLPISLFNHQLKRERKKTSSKHDSSGRNTRRRSTGIECCELRFISWVVSAVIDDWCALVGINAPVLPIVMR